MSQKLMESFDWYFAELLTDPVLLVALSGWLFAFFVVLALLKSAKARDREDSFRRDRLDGLVGRLDRIERLVSDVRSDVLRATQSLKGELARTDSTVKSDREIGPAAKDNESESATDSEEDEADPEAENPAPLTEEISRDLEDSNRSEQSPTSESDDEASSEKLATPTPAPRSLSSRLLSTRRGLFDRIRSVFSSKPQLDNEMIEELEALMIGSDVGVKTTSSLITALKADLQSGASVEIEDVIRHLKGKMVEILAEGAPEFSTEDAPKRGNLAPKIILVVGVNGVGKTTTTAKLANRWAKAGSSVLMVAADTFRAAAVEQLKSWGERLKIPVVSGAPDAKPQTVVFEAMIRAQNEPVDVVLIDTAGRLHTKQNLMEELAGIRNAVVRHFPEGPDEVWLVVDGATGQNAINQAREFNNATKLTGIVITKLDGTPKGGVVVAIKDEFGIPIKFIGVGEAEEDLRPFDAEGFVEAIFSSEEIEQPRNTSANAETRRRRREAIGA